MLPEGVAEIGAGAFENCENLTRVILPATSEIETIPENTFKGCTNLVEVTIPGSVTEIGTGAFEGCENLSSIGIPPTVEKVDADAFKGCTSLEEVNLGNGVTRIGEEAFSGCTSLKTVDIHSNVESIGTGAFKGCGIEELHLGTGIKTIGKDAFAGNEIKTVAISAQTAPKLEDGVLTGAENAKLYVQGAAAANVYKNAAGWSKYNPLQMTVAEQITTTSPKAIALSFENNSVQLNATLLPEDATMGKIFWESSNPDHVRVDNTGKVTLVNGKRARSEADALVTITARTMYHNGPICEFTINDLTTGVTIVSEDGTVSFDELNGLIHVYTLDGKQMKLDGSRLEKGIYIIKMNGKTQKVNIQ